MSKSCQHYGMFEIPPDAMGIISKSISVEEKEKRNFYDIVVVGTELQSWLDILFS